MPQLRKLTEGRVYLDVELQRSKSPSPPRWQAGTADKAESSSSHFELQAPNIESQVC